MEGLIYAYNIPNSEAQRLYLQNRRAELAAQRKASQHSCSSPTTAEHIESTTPYGSNPAKHSVNLWNSRKGSATYNLASVSTNTMETAARALHPHLLSPTTSNASKPIYRTMSEQQEFDLLSNPFELRHGRRYLRDLPYPLPCDLAEIQRQNLRTLLTITAFGKPLCNPRWSEEAPKRVLELGCGGGYWSAMAHDWFSERGHPDVEFVGIDVAPIVPDWAKTGMNWKFLQYDMRRTPFPFEDGYFDLVMMKDLSITMPLDPSSVKIFEDIVRCTKAGGAVEVWDSDHIIRSLAPDSAPAPSKRPNEREVAELTATYAIAPGHGFLPTRNKFLERSNAWIQEALDRRRLNSTPCTHIAETLLMEPHLDNIVARRVAIPLGELRWEQQKRSGTDSPLSVEEKGLTADQVALRQTALATVLQQIESFEPMLRDVSGLNSEEWAIWRASMLAELNDPGRAALTGECLELGAWWATKKDIGGDGEEA